MVLSSTLYATGTPLYDRAKVDVLAQRSLIEKKPEIVRAFVEASIEGWDAYLHGDPAPGNALIRRDNPDMTDDVIAQAIAKMREYGLALSGDAAKNGLGAMSDARWQEFVTVMQAQGVYPPSFPYTDGYTLAFVNKRHGLTDPPLQQ